MKKTWLKDWHQYDRDVHLFPDTIGASGFCSIIDDQIVGFASWDPRQFPDIGIIGHNCIVPEFQHQSFGKQQIMRIIDQFKKNHVKKAIAITGAHPFFLPARKMYQSCGFEQVDNHLEQSDFKTICFEMLL